MRRLKEHDYTTLPPAHQNNVLTMFENVMGLILNRTRV